jgi:hypothetical protein
VAIARDDFRRPRVRGTGETGGACVKLRGGSWINNSNNCRSACRNNNRFDDINNNIGFRVVVSASTLQGQGWRMGIRRACDEESSVRSRDAACEHPKIKRGGTGW